MKKVEEAAREYDWTLSGQREWRMTRPEEIKIDCFIAGARYVLDAMTSEEAVKLARFVHMLRGTPEDQLVAVRKEIEG